MLFPHMKPVTISRAEQKERIQNEKVERVTLSFYRYVRIAQPTEMRNTLFATFSELSCLGRIYVASEGINAQMNVPKSNFEKFIDTLQSISEFKDMPLKIAVEETDAVSFYKLTIKIKQKIVADGLDDASFDVTKTGKYLTAREMNEYIDDPEAIIFDMRNGYEGEVGHFERAIVPDVDTFREELKIVPELLKVHKNKKIDRCTSLERGDYKL